jgi:hypothetical protein
MKPCEKYFYKQTAAFLLLLVVLFGCCSDSEASEGKGSLLQGKVVDLAGKPLLNITVMAEEAGEKLHKGYEHVETKTGSDGSFLLQGLYPGSEYNITAETEGQCNFPELNILSVEQGETQKLDDPLVVRFSAFKTSSDGVVTDPRTGLQWAPDPGNSMTWQEANEYVKKLQLGGGGWRLPTMIELRGLNESAKQGCPIDYQSWNANSNIDQSFKFECCYAWSADKQNASSAWVLYFRNLEGKGIGGAERTADIDSNSYNYSRVLAVRPGK